MNELLIFYAWKLKSIVQPKKGFDSRITKELSSRRYRAEILPIRSKTQSNQSINNQKKY